MCGLYVWLVCVACMSVSIQHGLLYVYQRSKVPHLGKQNARKIAQIVLFVSHTAEIISLIPYNIHTIPLHSAQQTSIFHLRIVNKTNQTKQNYDLLFIIYYYLNWVVPQLGRFIHYSLSNILNKTKTPEDACYQQTPEDHPRNPPAQGRVHAHPVILRRPDDYVQATAPRAVEKHLRHARGRYECEHGAGSVYAEDTSQQYHCGCHQHHQHPASRKD